MQSKEEIRKSLDLDLKFIFTTFIIGDLKLHYETVEVTARTYEAAKLILLATYPDIDGFLYKPNPDYSCRAIHL